ncbi:hypothetical protein PoB_007361500 [Plakobranchus ocellatus]|uniref:Uncharacterized protein n=1 Tax=Plakobranchus ocellatus TaxID=259542 RepID=A0AAV4DSJ0_9GAST|nr:hypothetical protein PoB_007361500 [Plakobranchus ocellatus]
MIPFIYCVKATRLQKTISAVAICKVSLSQGRFTWRHNRERQELLTTERTCRMEIADKILADLLDEVLVDLMDEIRTNSDGEVPSDSQQPRRFLPIMRRLYRDDHGIICLQDSDSYFCKLQDAYLDF